MGAVEQGDLERLQRRAIRRIRLLVEHALRLHVLVRLRDQRVPVVVELVQRLHADSLVGDGVDRSGGRVVVVDDRAAGRNTEPRVRRRTRRLAVRAQWAGRGVLGVVNADVGVLAGEGRRHVVDVAAALLVVDHRAHGHPPGDQREVQHRRQVGVRIAVSRDPVPGLDVGLERIELGLVRDVADHAGLGAGTEQRALRTLQNLDAIEVGGVDVEVAIRELTGLIIEVDCDVRPHARRAAPLTGLRSGAQAAHEHLVLARPVVGGRHVRQKLDVVVERRDVQLLQGLRREGLHGDRHVLNVLGAALRGDGDLLERSGTRFTTAGRRLGSVRCAGRAPQDGRNRIGDLRVHCLIPLELDVHHGRAGVGGLDLRAQRAPAATRKPVPVRHCR